MCGGSWAHGQSGAACSPSHCVARRVERVWEGVSALTVEGCCGRYQGAGRNRRKGADVDRKCDVEEKGLKLSITEGWQEERSKVLASCSYLEEKFQECSNKEGARLVTSVETLGVDLRARTKQLEATE